MLVYNKQSVRTNITYPCLEWQPHQSVFQISPTRLTVKYRWDLTVFIHELELLASGAQYFVMKHLGFSKTVMKNRYVICVLVILHLLMVTCYRNMQQTSHYSIYCVLTELSFWSYYNINGWILPKKKKFVTCLSQLIPSCVFLSNFKTQLFITNPPF